MPIRQVLWPDAGPTAKLEGVNEPDEVITLFAALEIDHQVIRAITRVFFKGPLCWMNSPGYIPVGNRKNTVNPLVHFQQQSRCTGTAGKINHNTGTKSLA